MSFQETEDGECHSVTMQPNLPVNGESPMTTSLRFEPMVAAMLSPLRWAASKYMAT